MEEERREHVSKMKKMEMEMEQVFEMKVKEKIQKLKDSEAEVRLKYDQWEGGDGFPEQIESNQMSLLVWNEPGSVSHRGRSAVNQNRYFSEHFTHLKHNKYHSNDDLLTPSYCLF